MAINPSADPQRYDTAAIIPHLVYENVAAAVKWLSDVFGFVELERFRKVGPEGVFYHAEMLCGPKVPRVLLGPTGGDVTETPMRTGRASSALHVFVDDIDQHFRHVREHGGHTFLRCQEDIPLDKPELQFYGDLVYWVLDCDKHMWTFHQRVHDVAPEDWKWNVPLEMIPRAPLPIDPLGMARAQPKAPPPRG